MEEKRWCHEFRKILLDRGCGKYNTELGAETNYMKLKKEIQKQYGLTCTGYSERFSNARPDNDDKSGSYVRKIRYYLKRWIELSEIEKTYDGLFDLILRDKLIRTVATDVRKHVLSREPKTIGDVEKACDNYFDIFPDRSLGQRDTAVNDIVATIRDTTRSRDRSVSPFKTQSFPRPQSPYRSQSSYNSKSPNRSQSPQRSQSPNRPASLRSPRMSDRPPSPYRSESPTNQSNSRRYNQNYQRKQQNQNFQSRNRQLDQCFSCRRYGHWAEDCTFRDRDESDMEKSSRGNNRKVWFEDSDI